MAFNHGKDFTRQIRRYNNLLQAQESSRDQLWDTNSRAEFAPFYPHVNQCLSRMTHNLLSLYVAGDWINLLTVVVMLGELLVMHGPQ